MLYIKYMFLYFKGVLLGTYVEDHMFKIILFLFCSFFKYELTLLLFVALFHASLTSSLLFIMEIAIYLKLHINGSISLASTLTVLIISISGQFG